MSSASEPPLPEGWEAVVDDAGRTYYWNVDTDETSWDRPAVIAASSSVASSTRP